MCRFVAYLGNPIIIDDLLVTPHNSLIKQSTNAKETDEPLNGDGFGLGWYARPIKKVPALFKSISPAWNNQNLLNLSGIIKTGCLFAHVRAATEGRVSESNCHPFQFDRCLMMHNGGIKGFASIKRTILQRLSDPIFDWIRGQTDSEYIFALFIQMLMEKNDLDKVGIEEMFEAINKTMTFLEELKQEKGIDEPSLYNLVITDGNIMLATRYSSHPKLASRTLYYAKGTRYNCNDGVCKMEHHHEKEKAILIVSEKLTQVENDWIPVPMNHAITVDTDHQVLLSKIQLD